MIRPQYTYDNKGSKVGVFLAIEDWNQLEQIPEVSELSISDENIPNWQIELGKQELVNVAAGKADLLSWDESKKLLNL